MWRGRRCGRASSWSARRWSSCGSSAPRAAATRSWFRSSPRSGSELRRAATNTFSVSRDYDSRILSSRTQWMVIIRYDTISMQYLFHYVIISSLWQAFVSSSHLEYFNEGSFSNTYLWFSSRYSYYKLIKMARGGKKSPVKNRNKEV